MADYERVTAATIREVLTAAEETLTSRLPVEKVASDKYSITLEGEDGRVTITARREGAETVVIASTDQFRTSRLDTETTHFLDMLPYQPGEAWR